MVKLLVLLPLALTGLIALNLVAIVLWPDRIARARQALDRFPLRSLLLGVLILLTQVKLALLLPPTVVISVALDLLWLAQGFPALAQRVGRGNIATGTALLGLVWAFPVVGWLAGLGLGLTAMGAAVQ